MQNRQNHPYYNNDSLKDMNQYQSGQGGSNKQGKKSNYKYYKGDMKNNQNNMEDKNNMNLGDSHQIYPGPRQNRKNYQDMNQNPYFKKKNKKKRDNNDFQYQNNNASEISQSSKEDYLEQQNNSNLNNNNSNNNHQNQYNKQYKKNQMIFNNFNNNSINNNMNNMKNINNNMNINNNQNINNSNLGNISNLNLTPQRHNQITNPFGLGQNLQNNMNNLNQISKIPINPMIAQQEQQFQSPSQNKIYLNQNGLFLGMRPQLSMNDNEQDISLKDEKSSETLSEETLSTRGGNQNDIGNLQMNKNNNEYINPELHMNNILLKQQANYIAMPYNMNNINNINNINNSLGNINTLNNINNNNYNNINNLQNISNYNQNLVNQINNLNNFNNIGNINNLNNLSMGNFHMPIYDQQNNQLFNAAMTSNMKKNYSLPINDDININNHKKIKKIGNISPNEKNFSMNPSLKFGNILPNLNYKGPNINNNITNEKISLSSQPLKKKYYS